MIDAGQFAAVGVTMYFAHHLADHWVQTDGQAQHKQGSAGACLAHVATYVVTQQAFLFMLALVTDVRPDWGWAWLSWGLTAVTHYFADRRTPLRALAGMLGKGAYWDRGGAYHLDQAWHIGWLLPAAILYLL